LFEQIGERFGVALDQVHAVGDTLRDAQAAALAGCQTHLVCTGKSEGYRGTTPPENFPPNTLVHDNLAAFADWVLAVGETAVHTTTQGASS
jgi:D-glycero-D-manno-heptose 1,7-bisphosphate phosphatase